MRQDDNLSKSIDWLTVGFYAIFVVAGWLNVFAAVYDAEAQQNIFDFSLNSGKQLVWIGTSVVLIILILVIDYKFYNTFAYIMYGLMILLLIATIFLGTEAKGSRSWFEIGSLRIQPAEFAKFITALALATYLGKINIKFEKLQTKLICALIIGLPAICILLQNETGSVLVFSAFILVLYREGLSPLILILGLVSVILFILALIFPPNVIVQVIVGLGILALIYIITSRKKSTKIRTLVIRSAFVLAGCIICIATAFSVDFFVNKVLQDHQKKRILVLVNPDIDPLGAGYNVTQSKIAIGSGEFLGKGFLEGTQTKFDFVPEQSTDFIFCTIGEEHGWLGSTILIVMYVLFMMRLVYLAERQKDKFARIYGYSVACIIFFHFMVNIGMTIGIFPVIGIPLPFFSYGGSSLWSFTILLFIFLKLDAHRRQLLSH
ncbi:rod shape-determining protein [Sporocytophaga myxococcoides]|uniref:Cell wall polymerase n=1 Tax=Sporocytophaga myxococcoides TaxID=153721 RepID=A0A098LKT0_9BACT|nr:rod shape-determining protein RodA [Sporocytophaga myxococcoides]GAL87575.1 rod shape-determining protein [Sporocytophaga myxococcoides]